MNIKHPELLFLLLLIPAVLAFLYYAWKRRNQALTALCKLEKLGSLFPRSSTAKTISRYTLLLLTVIMFITAFISPRWGYDWKEIQTKGTNIVIALDVSASMLAEDVSPNRLTRAKFEITKLIDKLTGDRIGLIIFAGDAFLQSPLTHDYLMVKDWVSGISTDSVDTPGTSIKSALEVGLRAFEHVQSETKALIIMSDGEEHDEETLELVRRVHGEGINIYTIGIGTAQGSPVQSAQGLIRDTDGSVVISKLDDKFLKKIAEAGGGYYVRSSGGDFHLDQLYYDHIKADLKSEELKSGKTKQWYETYQLFMSIALIALVLEILLSIDVGVYALLATWFKQKKKNIFAQRSTKVILLFALAALPHSVQANILDPRLWMADSKLKAEKYREARADYLKIQVNEPHNSRLNYNLGVANYREGAYDQAVASFTRAAQEAGSKKLKEKSFYNLGNSYFMLQDYQQAINAYEEALKIDPNDEDAKFNLELARKKLKEQEENKDGDKKKDEQKQDQNKNKDKDQKNDKKNNKDQKQPENQDQQQPKPQPNKDELSKEDIDRLLRQAQEAKPGEVQKMQAEPRKLNAKKMKPW